LWNLQKLLKMRQHTCRAQLIDKVIISTAAAKEEEKGFGEKGKTSAFEMVSPSPRFGGILYRHAILFYLQNDMSSNLTVS
ncbi:MAG: hypothetical protein J6R82_01920, partial [Clostridia bacterium]|nr:hypothetical protein [Clostridia bacterium]